MYFCYVIIVRRSKSFGSFSGSQFGDDDLEFYDCEEEGGGEGGAGSGGSGGVGSTAGAFKSRTGSVFRSPTPPELLRFYGNSHNTHSNGNVNTMGDNQGVYMSDDHTILNGSGGGSGGGGATSAAPEMTSTRDIAVTIVETVFVLAEFSYWRVS